MSDRKVIIEAIDEARAAGARYSRAAQTIGLSKRTVERWRKDLRDDGRKTNRFSVNNALSAVERRNVLDTICLPEYMDLSPTQIVPILAENGRYMASEATIYRLMKKEGMRVHRGRARAPERDRPEEFVADGKNQVWTWDISYIASEERGTFYYLYLIVDIWDRCIVGWAIHETESGKLAAALLEQTCITQGVERHTLVVHQDNGAPMISVDFLSVLHQWGTPSYSRPGMSDDNPYSESLFRHLKYHHTYPERFASLSDATEWMKGFQTHYNHEHRHSGIGFVTPMQRRNGEADGLLKRRRDTYTAARSENPGRWSRNSRSWEQPEKVSLNPQNKKKNRRKAA